VKTLVSRFFNTCDPLSDDLNRMARAESFARTGAAGVGLFIASVVFMHAAQPELSPVDMAVSYYMNGRLGWVLGVGLVSLGTGSLSLAVGLRRLLARRGAGVWLLVVWGLGCIICGVFPPDPPGHWDEPSSASGMIHGNVAMVAFVALPAAAWLLSGKVAALAEMSAAIRLLRPLAILCAAALVVFFVCLAPVFANRPPYALGFVERVLIVLYCGWLVAVGVSVTAVLTFRADRSRAGRAR
jgi:hypothetical membrane protein